MTEKKRGFAAMAPDRRRELAALGGASVPPHKRLFFTNPEFARAAGIKGGKNVPKEKRTFSKDRLVAMTAAVRGGKMSARKKKEMKNISLGTSKENYIDPGITLVFIMK